MATNKTKNYYCVVKDKNSDKYSTVWFKLGSLQIDQKQKMLENALIKCISSIELSKADVDNYELHEFTSKKKAEEYIKGLHAKYETGDEVSSIGE